MTDKKITISDILADYQTLPEYIDRVLVDVNQVSLFGDYPLHVAAVRGSLEEIETLLENGANINVKGEHDFTPLHSAVEQGHPEAVKLILENGADSSPINVYGDTPLALALSFDETDETGKYKKIIEHIKRHLGSTI